MKQTKRIKQRNQRPILMRWMGLTLAVLLLFSLGSCGAGEDKGGMKDHVQYLVAGDAPSASLSDSKFSGTEDGGTKVYENPFVVTANTPISTFSADVDTASYAYFRKLLTSGYTLSDLMEEGAAIRTEEMVNYFDYAYALPDQGEVFGHTATIGKAPWNNETY